MPMPPCCCTARPDHGRRPEVEVEECRRLCGGVAVAPEVEVVWRRQAEPREEVDALIRQTRSAVVPRSNAVVATSDWTLVPVPVRCCDLLPCPRPRKAAWRGPDECRLPAAAAAGPLSPHGDDPSCDSNWGALGLLATACLAGTGREAAAVVLGGRGRLTLPSLRLWGCPDPDPDLDVGDNAASAKSTLLQRALGSLKLPAARRTSPLSTSRRRIVLSWQR